MGYNNILIDKCLCRYHKLSCNYLFFFFQGLIYTDRMFPLTFDYIEWDEENCTNVKKDTVKVKYSVE